MKEQVFLDAKEDLAQRLISDAKSHPEKGWLHHNGTMLLEENQIEDIVRIFGDLISRPLPLEVNEYLMAFQSQHLNFGPSLKSVELNRVYQYLSKNNEFIYSVSNVWPVKDALWCFFHCQLDPENLYQKLKLQNNIKAVYSWDQHGGFVGFEDIKTKEGVVSVLLSDDQRMKANEWRRK